MSKETRDRIAFRMQPETRRRIEQWYAADNYGEKSSSFGLVTGINVYLPRGSFDITLNLKDKGDCGLLAGYTIYLSR